jgi:hypothetical protein
VGAVAGFDSGSWSFFDVLARDAADGAHVAMALRQALPGAMIHSTPAASTSVDKELPHVLRCRAAISGMSAEETREALEAALADVPNSDARLAFLGDA